ncbi:MAG: hypothetical protein ACFB10_14595 [Salibacteraceae bacterium]
MKTCPHCQKELPNEEPPTTGHFHETLQALTEEEVVERATKEVIKAVLEHIQPLLDKLKEAQGTTAAPVGGTALFSPEQHQRQLEQIQQSAKDRMQKQEQHLAAKLQKLQARFSMR